MSRTVKTLTISVAVLALAPVVSILGARAAAAQTPAQKQLVVVYGDLDLSKEAGVRTLMARLDSASDKVCGARPSTDMHGQLTRYLSCRDAAVADAIRQIGSPALRLASAR